jgi:hypothetical protein
VGARVRARAWFGVMAGDGDLTLPCHAACARALSIHMCVPDLDSDNLSKPCGNNLIWAHRPKLIPAQYHGGGADPHAASGSGAPGASSATAITAPAQGDAAESQAVMAPPPPPDPPVPVPIPFDLPLTKYVGGDTMWLWDVCYSKPDKSGAHSAR